MYHKGAEIKSVFLNGDKVFGTSDESNLVEAINETLSRLDTLEPKQ